MIWALAAAALAVFLEYTYRTSGFHWWCLPVGALLTYLVYQTIRPENAPSLLVGIASFSLGTVLARMVLSQFVLGEPLVKGTLVAAAALLVANVAGRLWH